MEGKLKDASQELLEAAQKFWEISQEERGGSAVVWVEDVEGRCFIFTRGEYRHQLLAEVHKLDLPTAFFINEEEEEDVLPCQVKMNGRRCRLAQVQIMRRGQNLRGMCSLHVAVAEAGSVDGDLNECDPGFVHWHRSPLRPLPLPREPAWRSGILDVVLPEVLKCVTTHLAENPL